MIKRKITTCTECLLLTDGNVFVKQIKKSNTKKENRYKNLSCLALRNPSLVVQDLQTKNRKLAPILRIGMLPCKKIRIVAGLRNKINLKSASLAERGVESQVVVFSEQDIASRELFRKEIVYNSIQLSYANSFSPLLSKVKYIKKRKVLLLQDNTKLGKNNELTPEIHPEGVEKKKQANLTKFDVSRIAFIHQAFRFFKQNEKLQNKASQTKIVILSKKASFFESLKRLKKITPEIKLWYFALGTLFLVVAITTVLERKERYGWFGRFYRRQLPGLHMNYPDCQESSWECFETITSKYLNQDTNHLLVKALQLYKHECFHYLSPSWDKQFSKHFVGVFDNEIKLLPENVLKNDFVSMPAIAPVQGVVEKKQSAFCRHNKNKSNSELNFQSKNSSFKKQTQTAIATLDKDDPIKYKINASRTPQRINGDQLQINRSWRKEKDSLDVFFQLQANNSDNLITSTNLNPGKIVSFAKMFARLSKGQSSVATPLALQLQKNDSIPTKMSCFDRNSYFYKETRGNADFALQKHEPDTVGMNPVMFSKRDKDLDIVAQKLVSKKPKKTISPGEKQNKKERSSPKETSSLAKTKQKKQKSSSRETTFTVDGTTYKLNTLYFSFENSLKTFFYKYRLFSSQDTAFSSSLPVSSNQIKTNSFKSNNAASTGQEITEIDQLAIDNNNFDDDVALSGQETDAISSSDSEDDLIQEDASLDDLTLEEQALFSLDTKNVYSDDDSSLSDQDSFDATKKLNLQQMEDPAGFSFDQKHRNEKKTKLGAGTTAARQDSQNAKIGSQLLASTNDPESYQTKSDEIEVPDTEIERREKASIFLIRNLIKEQQLNKSTNKKKHVSEQGSVSVQDNKQQNQDDSLFTPVSASVPVPVLHNDIDSVIDDNVDTDNTSAIDVPFKEAETVINSISHSAPIESVVTALDKTENKVKQTLHPAWPTLHRSLQDGLVAEQALGSEATHFLQEKFDSINTNFYQQDLALHNKRYLDANVEMLEPLKPFVEGLQVENRFSSPKQRVDVTPNFDKVFVYNFRKKNDIPIRPMSGYRFPEINKQQISHFSQGFWLPFLAKQKNKFLSQSFTDQKSKKIETTQEQGLLFSPPVAFKLPPCLPFSESKIAASVQQNFPREGVSAVKQDAQNSRIPKQPQDLGSKMLLPVESLSFSEVVANSSSTGSTVLPRARFVVPFSKQQASMPTNRKMRYRRIQLAEIEPVKSLFDKFCKLNTASSIAEVEYRNSKMTTQMVPNRLRKQIEKQSFHNERGTRDLIPLNPGKQESALSTTSPLNYKPSLFKDYNDYNNYIKWPKQSLTAITVSPSLEYDKFLQDEFKEVELKRKAAEEAAEKARQAAGLPPKEKEENEEKDKKEGRKKTSKAPKDWTRWEELQIIRQKEARREQGKRLREFAYSNSFAFSPLEKLTGATAFKEQAWETHKKRSSIDTSLRDKPSLCLAKGFLSEQAKFVTVPVAKQGYCFTHKALTADAEKGGIDDLTIADNKQILSDVAIVAALTPEEEDKQDVENNPYTKLRFVNKSQHSLNASQAVSFNNQQIPSRSPFLVGDRKTNFFGIKNLSPKRLVAHDQKQINSQNKISGKNDIKLFSQDQDKVLLENQIRKSTAFSNLPKNLTEKEISYKHHLKQDSNPTVSKTEQHLVNTVFFDYPQHKARPHLRVRQSELIGQYDAYTADDTLQESFPHRWWQKRRIESSSLGSPSRRYTVMPEITTSDWKKIIEWQVKTYLFEEEKRIRALSHENVNNHFKIKRIYVYLPWVSLKKPLDKQFEWPITRLDAKNNSIQDNYLNTSSLFSKCGTDSFQIEQQKISKFNKLETTPLKAKQQCFVPSWRENNYVVAPLLQNLYSSPTRGTVFSQAEPTFLRASCNDQLKIAPLEGGGNAKPFCDQGDTVYKPFLFEPITRYSWLIVYQFLVIVSFKIFFENVAFLFTFRKTLEGVFKSSILSTIFKKSFPASFAEIKTIKKRFKDVVCAEDTITASREIVWYLRNSCRGRAIPRGVVLVGPNHSERIALLEAISSEAEVPVVMQSLSFLTKTQRKVQPERALEKLARFAQKRAPCVLFLDDLDSIGQSRTGLATSTMCEDFSTLHTLKGKPKWGVLENEMHDILFKESNLLPNSSQSAHNQLVAKRLHNQVLNPTTRSNSSMLSAHKQQLASTYRNVVKARDWSASNKMHSFFLQRFKAIKSYSDQGIEQETRRFSTSGYAFNAIDRPFDNNIYNYSNLIQSRQDDARGKRLVEERRIKVMLCLLMLMDGISHLKDIVVITTSQNPASLDPALLRAGRFERFITLKPANKRKRIEILKTQIAKIGHTNPMPWDYLGTRTATMTSSHICSAVQSSAFRAVMGNTKHTVSTLEHGLDRVTGNRASLFSISNNKKQKQADTIKALQDKLLTSPGFLSPRIVPSKQFKDFASSKTVSQKQCNATKQPFNQERLLQQKQKCNLRQVAFYKAGKGVVQNLFLDHPETAFLSLVPYPETNGAVDRKEIGKHCYLHHKTKGVTFKNKLDTDVGNLSKEQLSLNWAQANLTKRLVSLYAGRAGKGIASESTISTSINRRYTSSKNCFVKNRFATSWESELGYLEQLQATRLLQVMQKNFSFYQTSSFARNCLSPYQRTSLSCFDKTTILKFKFLWNKSMFCNSELKQDKTNQLAFRMLQNKALKFSCKKAKHSAHYFALRKKRDFFRGFVRGVLQNPISDQKKGSELCKQQMFETLDISKRIYGIWYHLYTNKAEQNNRNKEWIAPDCFTRQHSLLANLHQKGRSELFKNTVDVRLGSTVSSKRNYDFKDPMSSQKQDVLLQENDLSQAITDQAISPVSNKNLALKGEKKANMDCFYTYNNTSVTDVGLLQTDFVYLNKVLDCFYTAFNCCDENRELLDLLADHLVRFRILRLHEIMRICLFHLQL